MIDALPLLLGPEGYQISRSVRLRSSASAYFNRTPSSASNQQKFTWSSWFKRGALSASQFLLSAGTGNNDRFILSLRSGEDIQITNLIGGVQALNIVTSQLFRDPSAWYHLVVAIDTTDATSTNRCKVYLNGAQITAFSTATYPAQNYNTYVNSANTHQIGKNAAASDSYFDGYLTEVNFIDGQALTPASFGETNPVTGVWQPKKYAGTYGTNGFYLPFLQSTTATYGATFNGSSQYLTVPASSLFAPGTGDFTLEAWVNTASATDGQYVWSQTVSGTNYFVFSVDAAAKRASFVATTSGGGTPITSTANLVVGGWNHVAVVRQSGTVTVYCNGVGGTPTSNTMDINNTTYVPTIGRYTHSASQWFNGVISNLRYVKGTAVYTSNFTPASAPLTAISGTSFLSLQSSTLVDNSVNALTITNNGSVATSIQYPFNTGTSIGNDQSGQGNNWTPNNISLANNSTYDSMLDVPTQWADGGNGRGNYAVMNPIGPVGTSCTLTSGNLDAAWTSATARANTQATFRIPTSGKWYWEVYLTTNSNGNASFGIVQDGYAPSAGYVGDASTGYGLAPGSAGSGTMRKVNNNTYAAWGASPSGFGASVTYGVAVDMDAGAIYFRDATGWMNASNSNDSQPTSAAYTGLSGTYVSAVGHYSGAAASTATSSNFGQRPFAYTPPSGFKALNTLNLPTPTILKGNQYFDVVLYTGNAVQDRAVTGFGFDLDLAWIKSRNNAGSHVLVNREVGGDKQLFSNLTNAEQTNSDVTNGFTTGGILVGDNLTGTGSTNQNTYTYALWGWKEGATQGFDIVAYTGDGVDGRTVAHNLGVAPKMVIVKSRSTATNWNVKHASLSSNNVLQLNTTDAQSTPGSGYIGDLNSSTTFTLKNGGAAITNVNGNGTTYVAYLFAEVAGFSRFGSYTGNGSADGPFVFCGFRPRFVLIKRTDAAGNSWYMRDSARDAYNVGTQNLYSDLSNAEATEVGIDFTSNGFKIRGTSTGFNASGGTYIFAAFAENPFKNALAR